MNAGPTQSRPPSVDQWYRWMVQSVTGYAMFSTDMEGRIVTWDEGAERLFGYHRDDVKGENARFIFTPEDIARRAPEQELTNASANRLAPDERWHVKKDGTIFWASGLMMLLLDDHQRQVGFIKIVCDRTDEKRG
jgi:PAS domain S-box-containing protein